MRKVFSFVAVCLVIIGAFFAWKYTGVTKNVNVVITQNLEGDGWYWTQFNLPAGGDLMILTDFGKYREDRAFLNNSTFANFGISHGRVFFGSFCCAPTIPGKYVFLPTDDLNEGVKTLVFFAQDGSIWTIPIPKELLEPRNGEITVQAVMYK